MMLSTQHSDEKPDDMDIEIISDGRRLLKELDEAGMRYSDVADMIRGVILYIYNGEAIMPMSCKQKAQIVFHTYNLTCPSKLKGYRANKMLTRKVVEWVKTVAGY